MANWKLEAIKEQFNVFKTLTHPHHQIDTRDHHRLGKVYDVVQVTLKDHFIIDDKMVSSHAKVKEIGCQIIKQMTQDIVELSFVVIITNQFVNGKQGKMPVFVIKSKKECKFVDIKCVIYTSWEMYVKCNNPAEVEYIYPDNGYYKVGQDLKVHIRKSSSLRSITPSLSNDITNIVGAGVVVETGFFQHPVRKIMDFLKHFAEGFVHGIQLTCSLILSPLQTLAMGMRSGIVALADFVCYAQKQMVKFLLAFKVKMSEVWSTLTKHFWSTYKSVQSFFFNLYCKATSTGKRLFLAAIRKIFASVNDVESDFDNGLEKFTEEQEKIAQEHKTAVTRVDDKMFDDCKNQAALNVKNQKNSDQDGVNRVPQDILAVSDNLAKILQCDNLNDAKDIMETVALEMTADYKQKLNDYGAFLKAATKTTSSFNIKAYNKYIGIKEDEGIKQYYWNQTLQKFSSSGVCRQMKEKIEQLKSQKKLLLIPMTESKENSIQLYRCIGKPGGGMISPKDLLKALKEMSVQFDDKKLVISEIQTQVNIRSEDLMINMTQEVDSENTSDGIVAIIDIKSEE